MGIKHESEARLKDGWLITEGKDWDLFFTKQVESEQPGENLLAEAYRRNYELHGFLMSAATGV